MTKATHGISNNSNILQLSFLWSYLYHRLFLPHGHHHGRLYHLLWEHLFLQGAWAKISEEAAVLLDQCKTAGRKFHQAFKVPRIKSTLISPFTNIHNLVLSHYVKLSSAKSQREQAQKKQTPELKSCQNIGDICVILLHLFSWGREKE